MDEKKLKFNLEKINSLFPNKTILNKTQMLKVIGISESTWSRLNKQNNKLNIPEPDDICTFKRKYKKYNTYKYNIYDLAIFNTNKNDYWKMINDRNKSC